MSAPVAVGTIPPVTFVEIAARSTLRNAARTALTILGVAVSLVAFVMLRTVVGAWNAGAQYAAKDRLTTRSRASFGLPLPKRYVDEIRTKVPGVRAVTWCDWFGARWAKSPDVFFANVACADDAFELYPEIRVDPAALVKWQAHENGAIVGDVLAKQLGVKVGDRMTLEGSFYPGDWDFTVDGIYTAEPRSAVDRSTFFFRWAYKNDGVPERLTDQVGWIFVRVDDPSRSAEVSRRIDALFADRDVPTVTMSERAANLSLLGGVAALLRAVDVASAGVLAILTLVLGNTLAMGVRERTSEYGMLLALGFSPGAIRRLVVLEALVVSLAGALVGLALSYPIVEVGIGRFLEENAGQFFPVFRIGAGTALAALALTLGLGAVASIVPARRIRRMRAVDALRRMD